MEKAHQKEIRAKSAIEKLESMPVITSEQELENAIQDIEEKRLNEKECKAEKLRLIKNLLKRHAMINKQKVVPFSANRKPKTYNELKADYIHLMTCHVQHDVPPTAKKQKLDFVNSPELLVGNRIKQKFNEDGEVQWYEGYVVSFSNDSRLHEVFIMGIVNIIFIIYLKI